MYQERNMFSEKAKTKNELNRIAKSLLDHFDDMHFFAFYGKMGAGKTTFIQVMCRTLGSSDNITSPTFAIINEYRTNTLETIYHFDFYRIKDLSEAFDLGYEDYFYSKCFCFIEWPEKIEQLLPEKYVEVRIEALEDGTRTIQATRI